MAFALLDDETCEFGCGVQVVRREEILPRHLDSFFPVVVGVVGNAGGKGVEEVFFGKAVAVDVVEFTVYGVRGCAVFAVGNHAVDAPGVVAVDPAHEAEEATLAYVEEVVDFVHVAVVLILFLPLGCETAASEYHGEGLGNPPLKEHIEADVHSLLAVGEVATAKLSLNAPVYVLRCWQRWKQTEYSGCNSMKST